VTDALNAASQRMAVVTLAAQSATIGATALLPDTGSAGLFRVSWFLRVTQAATTSSSVAVTIGFTEGSVALTTSGAALTGNTTTTFQQGTLMLACDANSSITYAASYSSVGATSMQYGLAVIVERVNG
jgi:hypothetical protein